MHTRREAMVRAAVSLRQAGIEQPWFEAQLLLAAAAGVNVAGLCAHDEEFLSPEEHARFDRYVDQRVKRRPLAYITGKKYFLDWEFFVDENVLIPRPETELLVNLAVRELESRYGGGPCQVADIGTGSGAIGLSMLAMLPAALLAAVDLSQPALQVARINAERLGVRERACFLQGNLLEPLESLRGQLHCITANLPYIAETDFTTLQPEIVMYEPRGALVSGADGLDHYRSLLLGAREYLHPGGLAFAEIGSTQAEAVKHLFIRGGFSCPRAEKDLAGHARVVWAARD